MSVEPVESLMRRVMAQYNRRPEGWSVLTDLRGNVLILGPESGYRLKLIEVNPQEHTGVGVRVGGLEEVRRIVEGTPSYGLRPLSSRETRELLNAIHREDAIPNRLIERLLGMKPVPTSELEERGPKAILSGPIIAHPDLSAISEGQRQLERKLALEADKLFRKKYPERAAIYG